MTDNPQRLYDAASVYCLRIQNIIDHLSELGAKEQLKLLAGRLQRLSFRSTPLEDGDNEPHAAVSNR